MEDTAMCSCCGQYRPYPTSNGRWEFREHPSLAELYPDKFKWRACTIAFNYEGFQIIPDDIKEPIWHPNNAQWRKL
jgi:hypothetical protein